MLTLLLASSLEKVFSDAPLPASRGEPSLLKNERGAVQVCLRSDADEEIALSVSAPLPLSLYRVEEIYAARPTQKDAVNCTWLRGGEKRTYPDLLRPAALPCRVRLEAGKTAVFWAEFTGLTPGLHKAVFSAETPEGVSSVCAEVNVSKTEKSDPTLVFTNWFHADCLATCYNVPVFSEEHWRILGNFVENAVSHGITCLYTPLFTPALDTGVGLERPTTQLVGVTKTKEGWDFDFSLLRRWFQMALERGVKQFEFSHFFTQWGARFCPKVVGTVNGETRRLFGWDVDSLDPEYLGFLSALGPALTALTDELGLTGRCFVHVSDEPGEDDLPRYRRCAEAIHKSFSAFTHIDALSDLPFYREGLTSVPVPNENRLSLFREAGVEHVWTYYCSGQYKDELPNRFLAMPLARARVLGVLLWLNGCEGFLHWGFNFYYSILSKMPIDPFNETEDEELAFPSGDAFVVYPGENGEPLPSLREKVFYDGLLDYEALKVCEKRLGRETAEEIVRGTLGEIDFHHYPMDADPYLAFRKRLNAALG